ncbi:fumarylacetoacetate hydrolase family protein [Pragia fontium]|uniref:5-carboxy-2-oxohept-3-enedioate decarboxylase HpaG1 subunit n=1 Tax=Pragia fontium DSM 5563 = ATCC 49100 TaxID=1122977 RepID=A0AAJ4WA06_9GAMM|nr:fumarylacetoacetate hydrolase family protein [Pragia fontium]SFC66312.1 5-carboxy-2-oxohept-3-enedioate decarboxylase HpaG1 subunit [Pragia fontium DSM 5563 = ATCC 49100]VEJ56470.1 Homoprotocatechuate catabolism bifunctional isomerase/decarboxylase [Pragia fontium]
MKNNVFAVALNHKSQMTAWNSAFQQPPYQTLPKTPVWFIKPHNTVIGSLAPIPYPSGESEVLSGATLAIVIGKTARKVQLEQAADYIAGYTLANDVSLPETSFYRPAIKAKCCDGFCPISENVVDIHPQDLVIITEINGREVDRWSTADLIRSPHELVCALSDFATLQPGDKILIGTPHQRAKINPGDRVTVRAQGLADLTNIVMQQGATA